MASSGRAALEASARSHCRPSVSPSSRPNRAKAMIAASRESARADWSLWLNDVPGSAKALRPSPPRDGRAGRSGIALLFVANTINIGADLSAMGAAVKLVAGRQPAPLHRAVRALLPARHRVHSLSPLCRRAEVADLLAVRLCRHRLHRAYRLARGRWPARSLPKFELSGDSLTLIVAMFGTTISPYLFFWQSSQEVEEEEADPEAAPLLEQARAGAARSFSASAGNLVSAWACPTWSPSSSC